MNSTYSDNHKFNVNVHFRKENLEAIVNILHKTAVELCFFLGRFGDSDRGGRSRERENFTPYHELSISVRPMRTIF